MRTASHPKLLLGLALSLCLSLGGCFQPANLQELKNHVLESYTTSSPDRLYYIGSDNNYDYYYLQKEDQRYKIPQSQSLRDQRMNLTNNRDKWQVVSPVSQSEAVKAE